LPIPAASLEAAKLFVITQTRGHHPVHRKVSIRLKAEIPVYQFSRRSSNEELLPQSRAHSDKRVDHADGALLRPPTGRYWNRQRPCARGTRSQPMHALQSRKC